MVFLMPKNIMHICEVMFTMQKIAVRKILKKNSVTEVQLDGNHSVMAVKLKFSNAVSGLVTIECAQNNVFSDLILFAETELNEETEKEIKVKIPVAASHIFISSADIQEVCVYEQETGDVNNFYPLVKKIELDENYYLDTVSVFTAEEGYSHYSIYTSMDGRDFAFLARKSDDKNCDKKIGDVYNAQKREARFIRVLSILVKSLTDITETFIQALTKC